MTPKDKNKMSSNQKKSLKDNEDSEIPEKLPKQKSIANGEELLNQSNLDNEIDPDFIDLKYQNQLVTMEKNIYKSIRGKSNTESNMVDSIYRKSIYGQD